VVITKYLSNDSRVLCRDFNPGLPEHEAEVLTNLNVTFGFIHLPVYFSLLKMEAERSSETSLNVYRTTRRYILGKSASHRHCCENLKSK
jgi:hypothetical protein